MLAAQYHCSHSLHIVSLCRERKRKTQVANRTSLFIPELMVMVCGCSCSLSSPSSSLSLPTRSLSVSNHLVKKTLTDVTNFHLCWNISHRCISKHYAIYWFVYSFSYFAYSSFYFFLFIMLFCSLMTHSFLLNTFSLHCINTWIFQ